MDKVKIIVPEETTFYHFNENRVELVKNELFCQIDKSVKQCEKSATDRFRSALKSFRTDDLSLNLRCISDNLTFRFLCIKLIQRKDKSDIVKYTRHFLTEATKLSYINADLEYIVYLINVFHKYEEMQRENERRKERQERENQIPEQTEENQIPEQTEKNTERTEGEETSLYI